uniref:Uncharacterized protein n=1 Tax=Oryza barthii TaxID=65489 RepID=A0A0D3GEE9_9ORYZ
MQNIKSGSKRSSGFKRRSAAAGNRRDAMIHLRRCVLSRLLRPPCLTAATHANSLLSLHLRRLLSSAAEPFAVEDYLVESCGLTRARAEKVSGKLSHLRSPSKPDAVLAFLSGLGLTRPDIAAAVASDPRLLCARVDRTLDARVAELGGIGLSRSQIARLIPLARGGFRIKSLGSKLAFLVTVPGGCQDELWAIKPGTRLFALAVVKFAILSQEKITKKSGLFKKLGWSQEDLSLAAKNMPSILAMGEKRLRQRMKFLTEDVGLEIPYIAQRPALMFYSIERRLLPRHCLINVLKRNGLLKINYDFYSTALISNEKFLDKFVHPYVESVPGIGASFLASSGHRASPPPRTPIPSSPSTAAAAAPIPPEPFAVEDYLVDSCGLTRARAKKASGKLSHLRSPSNPDAVLAFLSGLGLSRPDIAAVVVNDPLFICARVDKTLATRVAELADLGLSRSQIARLIPVVRSLFRCKSLAPRLAFLLTVFGSFDRCLEVIKTNYGVLSSNVEAVIKPNLAVLKECGISIADRPSYAFASRVISRPTKHLEEAVVLANEFGAKQGTRVFTNAVMIFGILGQEKLAKKLEFFKKLGWSQDDLSLAVRSMPHILAMKEERMRRGMKFLTEDVGLEIPYIARRPALTMYSIERRLLPRHCLINVLKGNGLLKADYDFYNISVISNDDFMEKFVQPYVESVPGLGDAYASSCTGCGVHQLKLLSKLEAVLEEHKGEEDVPMLLLAVYQQPGTIHRQRTRLHT